MNDNRYLIFGPCSLESFEQISQVAKLCTEMNIVYMRAQLFKPRTSPYSFQGLGIEGIEVLKELRKTYQKDQIRFVTEVCSLNQLEAIAPYTQVFQIGARNMQNFELLKDISKFFNSDLHDYVLLKRGLSHTVEEWLSAAEYLIQSGIPKDRIVLCERGLRLYGSPTNVSLDFLGAIDAQEAGFKVIIDPSHGTRDAKYIKRISMGAAAMDFDGLMIECHPEPRKSLSDEKQALSLEEARDIINNLTLYVHHGLQLNHSTSSSCTTLQS